MASGDTLIIFTPLHNEAPPVGGYTAASFDSTVTATNHPVLDFDATTVETAIFSGVMPRNYAGTTGVTVSVHYAMSSAATGTIDWDAAWEVLADGADTTTDGFAAVNSVDNVTVPATASILDVQAITFTDGADMDSVAAGNAFRLKLQRDSANDDAPGDAEFFRIEVKET